MSTSSNTILYPKLYSHSSRGDFFPIKKHKSYFPAKKKIPIHEKNLFSLNLVSSCLFHQFFCFGLVQFTNPTCLKVVIMWSWSYMIVWGCFVSLGDTACNRFSFFYVIERQRYGHRPFSFRFVHI